jgi:hypothetical protein
MGGTATTRHGGAALAVSVRAALVRVGRLGVRMCAALVTMEGTPASGSKAVGMGILVWAAGPLIALKDADATIAPGTRPGGV